MSINKLFAVLHCQPRTRNRLRGEARNGRRAIYVDRSRRRAPLQPVPPRVPPGARDRLGQSQTPSIQLPSELSARRFALLAEQRHSLCSRCLLSSDRLPKQYPRVLRLAMGPKASC